MTDLWTLKKTLEAADQELLSAKAQARRLNLPGTQIEIERARSAIDSIIFEMEQKRVPEFADQPRETL